MRAAKMEAKAENEAEAAKLPIPEPLPVSADYIAKQQRFFALAKEKEAEFRSLSSEEAERAYDQLKHEFLSE